MDNIIDFSTKEIVKRNIAERLETTWSVSMAYAHLQNFDVDMLLDLQKFLIYKELTIKEIKSKSGFAIQMIKTYKSIKKNKKE